MYTTTNVRTVEWYNNIRTYSIVTRTACGILRVNNRYSKPTETLVTTSGIQDWYERLHKLYSVSFLIIPRTRWTESCYEWQIEISCVTFIDHRYIGWSWWLSKRIVFFPFVCVNHQLPQGNSTSLFYITTLLFLRIFINVFTVVIFVNSVAYIGHC